MSNHISAQMKHAVKLIAQGKSRYAAAKIAGVTVTGITRSKLYQELVAKAQKVDKR